MDDDDGDDFEEGDGDEDGDDWRVGKCDSDHWNPILGIRLTLPERGCCWQLICNIRKNYDILHWKYLLTNCLMGGLTLPERGCCWQLTCIMKAFAKKCFGSKNNMLKRIIR